MTTHPDPYATEAETDALLAADTRTPAERRLAALFDARGGNEQGAEPEAVLRAIALELIEAQGTQPTDRQVMQQALDALEGVVAWDTVRNYMVPYRVRDPIHESINGLRAALAAPQPEPCGWQFFQDGKWHNGMETNDHRANTEAAGIPTRNVYPGAAPQPAQEPAQEPAGYANKFDIEQMRQHGGGTLLWQFEPDDSGDYAALYTTPQAPQPLTDEELLFAYNSEGGLLNSLRAVQSAILLAAPQPAQEPVAEVVMAVKPPNSSPAWLPFKTVYAPIPWLDSVPVGTKLYTTPQAPQPLTDKEGSPE